MAAGEPLRILRLWWNAAVFALIHWEAIGGAWCFAGGVRARIITCIASTGLWV